MFNMQTITPIKFHNPSFGLFFHDVKYDDGELRYRGDTALCRDDLYFPEVIDFLNNKYKNTPKVNVVMHACSDGEEVYSFLGVLVSKLKEKASKFLPVSAKDVDSEHLELAQKGIYHITDTEFVMANDYMNGEFYNYFETLPNKISKDPKLKYTTAIKANDLLKKFVNFKQSNILKDVSQTDFKNTVLFARNFWPYLSDEERHKLAKTLSKKMDYSSTLIIGNYDKEDADIGSLLKMYGFEETKIENVYEKRRELVYY